MESTLGAGEPRSRGRTPFVIALAAQWRRTRAARSTHGITRLAPRDGATVERYGRGLRNERRAVAAANSLDYVSETTLDHDHRRMLVHERYVGSVDRAEVDETYDFVMRCWTAEEVRVLAAHAGFTRLEVLWGEDAGIAADRLLVTAVAESTGSASTLL